MLGQFILHVRKQKEETTDSIPQSWVCQCLLIQCARTLNDFCEGVENLTGHPDGFEEVSFAGWINDFLYMYSEIDKKANLS